jgi:hypothetical protein
MGTRGVVGFVVDGVWKVTYNHFDSYPSGLGVEVLDFCRSRKSWDRFKALARKVELVDSDSKPTEEQIKQYTPFSDIHVSNQTLDDWYCLLRNTQGVETLKAIAQNKLWHMIDSHLFMDDSLFCEWGYVINLDTNRLIIY